MSEPAHIFRVARLEARVAPFDWDFARERAPEIAAHWAGMIAEKPALFDGRVLLGHTLEHRPNDGGELRAQYFETAFSAFMAWRDFGFPGFRVFNGFAMAALRAADGAFLLGEMAAQTANAPPVPKPTATTPDTSTRAARWAAAARKSLRQPARENRPFDGRQPRKLKARATLSTSLAMRSASWG